MPTSNPVDDLHTEYRELQSRYRATPTRDQAQSLRYYTAEIAFSRANPTDDHVPNNVIVWVRNLLALEAFVAREGRMPRENRRLPAGTISSEEKGLTHRVRAQRKAFADGRLSSYQERRLLCIPGFAFQPQEDQWQAKFILYSHFTDVNRRAPRARSRNASEKTLASWAAKVRMAYWAGTLAPSRIDSLNNLTIWTWGNRKDHR
ncbi:hypothetical protein GY21_08810 [Cryobacterium roopkundense]|uniref:Helicase-associated domain-containing protein n=1 Tax=Cryobacterium roopkundense TaxID=1001240 RepID=A0A099JFC0_9MICO|nr:hypothetical protein [Cryobacterium roopkundense]KGJ76931.1 hypothetical protein GY21_08810 [Cryobacterium roopkundense]MBB5643172.1 hypothetical protein [Cryobacterium roopkundense]